MYAVIETGGKQYRVSVGDELNVEKLEAEVGNTVTLDRVFAVEKDGFLAIGTPVVPGAKVIAKVVEHGKGPKIRIFKYKNKTNQRRRQGHRQPYTRLAIEKIEA